MKLQLNIICIARTYYFAYFFIHVPVIFFNVRYKASYQYICSRWKDRNMIYGNDTIFWKDFMDYFQLQNVWQGVFFCLFCFGYRFQHIHFNTWRFAGKEQNRANFVPMEQYHRTILTVSILRFLVRHC